MTWKMNTLGKKIGYGYGLVTLVLVLSVAATLLQVRKVDEVSERLLSLRQPSARADIELLSGINRSIGELRGWMLLKKDTFKTGRRQAWKVEIRPALATLEQLSVRWTNTENIQRKNLLVPLINEMEGLQEQIEVLSETDLNAAIDLLDDKVLPINKEIKEIVSIMAEDHERLMLTDFAVIRNQISLLSLMEWILLIAGALISALLAIVITRSVTGPMLETVLVAQEIGSGNLDAEVKIGGSLELDNLGRSLIEMRDSLKRKSEEARRYDWMTRGQNALYDVMRGDKEETELADDIVRFIAEYTDCKVGALYLASEGGNDLTLAGRYAMSSSRGVSIKGGEGLVGQVAADQKSFLLRDMPDENMTISSSMISFTPTHVLLTPFLYDGKTLGVIELGKLEPFDEQTTSFVDAVMENVGITLYSAISRKTIKLLLEETQQQSEELQQQQEELEQSNAELEEQTHRLKEQQEELQASNQELEEQKQVVEQKNTDLEIARTDVELKAKQLEITSKYKSEFLANMSHELRTPLNSLLILSNDLAKNKADNLSEEQVESAQIIAKSGYDLLNLINEILDLSKIEAGKMELNLTEVSPEEVSHDLLKNFRRLADEKSVKLTSSIGEGIPEKIRTDRQRLDQVLKNLMSNALKFTEKGSVEVAFNLTHDQQMSISVKDTGIGIPEDKQTIIFEAFQQAEGGTSRKYGGTGLGLSISRELAKLLGGSITLESVPSEGSTFTLFLPLEVNEGRLISDLPEKTDQKPTISSQQFINYPSIDDDRNEISGDSRTVLIIEDDLGFAKILSNQARAKGFKFLAASSGEDGLILAAQYRPNAILLDIELPGIDGHMVLKELKGNPDLRHIPVHVISSNEKTLDPIRSGAVEYITKPVSKERLDEAFMRMENFMNKKLKNLLIIEDSEAMRKSIVNLIGNGDVICIEAATAKEALLKFKNESIDCIVLDIGLPDSSGFELIKKFETENNGEVPPIIVYTGKELTKKENEELQEYAETIIVKGVKSDERLLDETALFLHRTVGNLPQHKQEMITQMYDTDVLFHGKKVLLVDDDMRNIFALSKVLKEKGLEIIKAENGKVALEVLDDEIDLVLMDIMMPEMDGYECMREIRKRSRFKNLPIIALTAKAMKEDRGKCIEAGANDYITKPVDVDRLFSLMRIWIKRQ